MNETVKGTLTTTLSFLLWGLFPIYWKALRDFPALQILSHRILWAFAFFVLLITFQSRWNQIRQALGNRRNLVTLVFTSTLITTNWLVFIWAVNSGQIVEASLGCFINPLVNVLLAMIILRERLYRWQMVSVLLAAAGVLILTLQIGRIPWIALTLACSFGSYGLLRKMATFDSLVGLTLETAFLTPLALIYLIAVNTGAGSTPALYSAANISLLLGAGVVTAIPLLLYIHGARRIRFSTAGFLQYIAPSLQLLLGVFLYGEIFTGVHMVSFMFIWAALLIYTVSTGMNYRRIEIPASR